MNMKSTAVYTGDNFSLIRNFYDEDLFVAQLFFTRDNSVSHTRDTLKDVVEVVSKAMRAYADLEWRVMRVNVADGVSADISEDIMPMVRPLDYGNICAHCSGKGVETYSHKFDHQRSVSLTEGCWACGGAGFHTKTPEFRREGELVAAE
jgi:hypothetical protein